MPLTVVDDRAALVVVDLQKGILGLETAHPVHDVLDRSVRLADAFRAAGHAVALVNVTGGAPGRTDAPRPAGDRPSDWADLAPELGEGDVVVTKQTWGAFTGTDLHEQLQARGVTQVFLTGIATTAGVESTARHAHELGYHVVLVTDAMTDRSAAAHDHSVERVFPRLGETATTDEVLAAL